MHYIRTKVSQLYFRCLFSLVRRAGFAVVHSGAMGDAMQSALECHAFCDRSGFLRDGNGNSHKCGKRAEMKVRGHLDSVRNNLCIGLARSFSAEGTRSVW